MLVDPNKKSSNEGFNPNVDNSEYSAQCSLGQKILWWTLFVLSWLTIIVGIILLVLWFKWGNKLNQMQVEINRASSSIDVALTKRKELLTKMLDQTKGYMNYESNLLSDVTRLRSMKLDGKNIKNSNECQAIMDRLAFNLNANFENYPNLKANSSLMELMSTSQYLESEIAACRRLYNSNVADFNKYLVTFPTSVKASSMKLHSLPMFAASESQKQDVKMEF